MRKSEEKNLTPKLFVDISTGEIPANTTVGRYSKANNVYAYCKKHAFPTTWRLLLP